MADIKQIPVFMFFSKPQNLLDNIAPIYTKNTQIDQLKFKINAANAPSHNKDYSNLIPVDRPKPHRA